MSRDILSGLKTRGEFFEWLQAKLRTSYLETTETTDPVQWLQQLYNEDVS